MGGLPYCLSFVGGLPQALELDSKYVKAWAKKGDIEFFMKEYHKALDSYKMVGQTVGYRHDSSLKGKCCLMLV